MHTIESDGFAAKQAIHNFEALFKLRATLGGLGLKTRKFPGLGAPSNAEVKTPAAQHIDHRRLLGKTNRVVKRHDRNGGTQTDAFGFLRDGGAEN